MMNSKKLVIMFLLISAFGCGNLFAQMDNVPPMDAEFDGIDADKDGFVALEEMQAYQEKNFNEADKDKNGTLDASELKNDNTGAFAKADKDNNGEVSQQEAYAQFNEYFNQMDSNKDNNVSREEFKEYWPVVIKF